MSLMSLYFNNTTKKANYRFTGSISLSFLTLILILFIIVLSNALSIVYAANSITDDSDNVKNLYFTGSESATNRYYKDMEDPNNWDVGLKICGHGQVYAGGTYALYVNGSGWKYALITYNPSNPLAYTNIARSGGCYYTEGGQLTFSPSYLSSYNLNVYIAAFPGRIWIGYDSTNPNPSSLNNFEFIDTSYGYLRGNYSVSRSYNQSSNTVSVSTPTIYFKKPGQTITKSASDSEFGVSNEKRMVIGFCDNDYGSSCADGEVVSSSSQFPLSFSTGISASQINDQHTYNKYVVINSLGYPICIGANLKPVISSVSPNPIYYGQTLSISYYVQNPRDTPDEDKGGNVDVTTDFKVRIRIYKSDNTSLVVFNTTRTITNDISPNGYVSDSVSWDAYAHSGYYKVEVTADYDNDITECDESDNVVTYEFELKPVYIPYLYIDGVQTYNFSYPGVPYNVTLHLKNSDGDNVSNATVWFVEKNGINLLAPLQIWNRSISTNQSEETGLVSYSIGEIITDYRGISSFTLIPTSNKLYSNDYSINLSKYVGNHSFYIKGWTQDNETLIFNVNGNIQNTFPLYITHPYEYVHSDEKDVYNRKNYVMHILDFAYEIFSTFWKSIIKI